MESKDRIDGLVKLAELRTKRWISRREIEWRISLSLWALLVGAVFYLKGKPIPLFFGLALIIGHAILTEATRVRNWRDQWLTLHYIAEAEKILLNEPLTTIHGSPELSRKQRVIGFLTDYSAWVQVGTTILLVLALYLVPGSQ